MIRIENITHCRSFIVIALIACICLFTFGCTRHAYVDDEGMYNPLNKDFQNSAYPPPSPKTLYTMARVLKSQGKYAEAAFVYQRSLNEYPRFMPAYNDLAELYMRFQQSDDAVHVLQAGIEINPSDDVLINNLGMCSLFAKDYEHALIQFTNAAAIRHDETRYRANMAVALAMLERYDESLAMFRTIMTEEDAQYNMIILHSACGDSELADDTKELPVPSVTENTQQATEG